MNQPAKIALWSSLFLTGLAVALSALLSRSLGLGEQEDFLFYRLWGIARFDTLSAGLTLSLMSAGILARTPWLGWLARPFTRAEQALAAPWRLHILLVLTVGLSLFPILIGFGRNPLLVPDSNSYLHYSVFRSLGYPVFLSLARALTGSLNDIFPIQSLLLDGAFVMLALEVSQLTRRRLLGLGVGLLLICQRWQQVFGMTIASEALFVFLVTLHIWLAIRYFRLRETAALLAAFATLAAACIVRPAGYSLFLGIPLLALLAEERKIRVLVTGVLVTILVMAGASAGQYFRSGQFSPQSFTGIVMIGQVAPLLTADIPSADPALTAELAAALEPFQRSFEGRSYPGEYWTVTSANYNAMLWSVIIPIIKRHINQQDPGLSPDQLSIAANQVAMSQSIAVLKNRPFGFARHVLAHFYGMWAGVYSMPESLDVIWPRGHETLQSLLASSAEGSNLGLVDHPRPQGPWADLAVKVNNALTGLIGLARIAVFALAFSAPLFFFSRPRDSIAAKAKLYLYAQLSGYFLLVAISQASISRYPAAYDAVSVTLAALALARLLPSRQRTMDR